MTLLTVFAVQSGEGIKIASALVFGIALMLMYGKAIPFSGFLTKSVFLLNDSTFNEGIPEVSVLSFFTFVSLNETKLYFNEKQTTENQLIICIYCC